MADAARFVDMGDLARIPERFRGFVTIGAKSGCYPFQAIRLLQKCQ